MINCVSATQVVTLLLRYDPGMREPLPPGACHPAYREMTWLRDWLNGTPGYPHDRVEVAMMPRLTLEMIVDSSYPDAHIRRHTLHKEKAAGLAPYVGEPFVYIWYVGTDELGRSVAGDATIKYLDPQVDARYHRQLAAMDPKYRPPASYQ